MNRREFLARVATLSAVVSITPSLLETLPTHPRIISNLELYNPKIIPDRDHFIKMFDRVFDFGQGGACVTSRVLSDGCEEVISLWGYLEKPGIITLWREIDGKLYVPLIYITEGRWRAYPGEGLIFPPGHTPVVKVDF